MNKDKDMRERFYLVSQFHERQSILSDIVGRGHWDPQLDCFYVFKDQFDVERDTKWLPGTRWSEMHLSDMGIEDKLKLKERIYMAERAQNQFDLERAGRYIDSLPMPEKKIVRDTSQGHFEFKRKHSQRGKDLADKWNYRDEKNIEVLEMNYDERLENAESLSEIREILREAFDEAGTDDEKDILDDPRYSILDYLEDRLDFIDPTRDYVVGSFNNVDNKKLLETVKDKNTKIGKRYDALHEATRRSGYKWDRIYLASLYEERHEVAKVATRFDHEMECWYVERHNLPIDYYKYLPENRVASLSRPSKELTTMTSEKAEKIFGCVIKAREAQIKHETKDIDKLLGKARIQERQANLELER